MKLNNSKQAFKRTRTIITSGTIAAVLAAQGMAFAAPALLSGTASAASPISTSTDTATGTIVTPVSPTSGQTVSGSIPVTVKLNDTTNPSSTSFFAGDTLTNSVGTDITSQAGLSGSMRNNTTGTSSPGGQVYSDAQSSGAKTMFDTTKLPDGQYTLTYTATDGLFGVKTTRTVTFNIDNAPAQPGPTIAPVKPTNGATISGSTPVEVKLTYPADTNNIFFASDKLTNSQGADVTSQAGLNGELRNNVNPNYGPGIYNDPDMLNSKNLPNGQYTLTYTAEGDPFVGETTQNTKSISFTINNQIEDTAVPSINILKPTANASTTKHVKVSNQSALTFSGTAKDDQTSVAKVNLKLYDLTTKKTAYLNNQIPVSNGQWSVTIPAHTLTNGDHIQVIASGRDQAGNVGVDHAYFYVSDTLPPSQQDPIISSIHPTNGATVSGKIKVRAKITASPNGGQVSPTAGEGFVINGPNGQPKNINGQLVDSNGNGVFTSRTLDTTTWANGTYKLTVNADDNQFNTSSKTVTFTVNNSTGGGRHN
ncbi:MAG: Ig-like domain-containing protein, partial [Candidatus Saccharimonadales bacterium]